MLVEQLKFGGEDNVVFNKEFCNLVDYAYTTGYGYAYYKVSIPSKDADEDFVMEQQEVCNIDNSYSIIKTLCREEGIVDHRETAKSTIAGVVTPKETVFTFLRDILDHIYFEDNFEIDITDIYKHMAESLDTSMYIDNAMWSDLATKALAGKKVVFSVRFKPCGESTATTDGYSRHVTVLEGDDVLIDMSCTLHDADESIYEFYNVNS